TLTLAEERVGMLDKFVIEQDNVVASHIDLGDFAAIGRRWKLTAARETPTVNAILVLDATSPKKDVLAFHSLAPAPDSDTFRWFLLRSLVPRMNMEGDVEELRHLHFAT